ncbi:acyl-CoA dehydrogenase family protein [Actinoplanes solisilvae]|uniref:acyl-CoA dehydrogenase family protein n=1 Tax=Actinoplanes solisilvae TaxID=2486853 RepID=UPI000FDBA968|nr:acyl-CoA dehydrogenase family protein [Actinoplanes solisilvae]
MDRSLGEALAGNVQQFADRVLRPAALGTDRDGVPPSTIEALAGLGLLNHLAPAEYEGAAADRGTDRRLHEILAGACANTWLVWAQHAPMVGRIAAADGPPGRLAESALRGRLLLGAAISDVRHFPGRHIAATRVADGWIFDGTVSWVSGWGLNEALGVAAVDSTTRTVVTALVPVGDRTRGTPLRLSAVAGSHTERVRLDRVPVPDEDVIAVQDLGEWQRADLNSTVDARPHLFGLAATVLGELASERAAAARAVADVWGGRVDLLRAQAYALADEVARLGDGAHRVDERLALKVAAGEALATLTRALVIARSGRGISAGDTAQFYARSALFFMVQGQSVDAREAQLNRLAK